jgi:hypothetical protein
MCGSWHSDHAGDYRISLIFGDLKDFPDEARAATSYGRRMRTRSRYWMGIAVGTAGSACPLPQAPDRHSDRNQQKPRRDE